MEDDFTAISFEERYRDEARVNPDLQKAIHLLNEGGRAHQANDIEKAIEIYQDSIAFYPTADAHTYLGWMYSFQGRLEEAIEECHQAIELDDEFGNPYNDIGCYLMQLEEFDEAMGWFAKAKKARRYEPRHFPYINMGRIYLRKAEWGKALGEFRQALRQSPEEESLKRRVIELTTLLN